MANGYEWAALELDDFGNYPRWPAFRDACAASGILPGVWLTKGWNVPMTPPDASFTIAELEGEDDYQGIISAGVPAMPHAVLTNFSPLRTSQGVPIPEKAAALIERGYVCLTEAYIGDNPQATPDRLDFSARQLGWDASQPCFGVHSAPLEAFEEWMEWPGCDYLAEYVL